MYYNILRRYLGRNFARPWEPYDFARFALLLGWAAMLCAGCAGDGARRQAASDRDIERTEQSLIAAGDADSLAAAAMLGIGPNFGAERRLHLISRAVEKAPGRADLVWLNLRLCLQVAGCKSQPLEAALRALDPGNGAFWVDSIDRAAHDNDAVAMREALAAVSRSARFDTYWNPTVVHAANAILKTRTMKLRNALFGAIGAASAMTIPAYQAVVNACKGESLRDPAALETCRRVSAVMRRADTYLTEMIGVAIAKHAWPEGSAPYLDAVSAERVARYRMDADAKIGLHRLWSPRYAAERLHLMTQSTSEQEVVLEEILNAGVKPNPPAGWAGNGRGS